MKLTGAHGRRAPPPDYPFSILKRIVMGETTIGVPRVLCKLTFSILKRIVMGETTQRPGSRRPRAPFSILKRIVMGETILAGLEPGRAYFLSVSSSGS